VGCTCVRKVCSNVQVNLAPEIWGVCVPIIHRSEEGLIRRNYRKANDGREKRPFHTKFASRHHLGTMQRAKITRMELTFSRITIPKYAFPAQDIMVK